MPELPEVETVANGVHARIAGDQIVSAWFSAKPEPFKTPPLEMAEALTGRTIQRVHRVGKHIVVDLAAPAGDAPAVTEAEWIVHLGMTGRLLVSQPDVPLPAHTHAQLVLHSGRELRFVDARRFGRLDLRRLDTVGGFAGPGAEPLSIPADAFIALFRGRKLAIKAALLNQSLLHGVGNIYADESLHRAGIRPSLAAGKVSGPRLRRLHAELQSVLLNAIALGGSSVSDYVDADGVRGFFQLEHRVYARKGQPCLTCGTPIRRTIIGGRSTHSCPKCQR
ncbi:bifunctional DNA-formamidopyrimidine glycosylase/DNA-(apurinic or apyrimidinic site) lyase [Acidipila sp. EB88]|uniref:bifunctional DNA-formamidopyrimidine glycosylase/DNA-(apurinic or apyrimidinic site) lyase n=1 Tax=Acidipila sp. EB88 TaxID=2305226 RepID=UPI000F5EEDBD|nr:bifunctional DNA-formamidopyrimidine glycosylase/DNA-(apurinic or apyrimidinic site) lyase [Acidipila sp. EB88]RRA47982.1 bifunctional DNA-formamidopyrimidine glycosylase/DNA-(apurinic or apyrimidinic site) lyase [Acidipila sp. EB88]